MDCQRFQTLLDNYLDGTLARRDARDAGRHLMACPSCEQEVTSVQQTRALLSSAVADAAAAVDVSGMWEAIDAAVPHRTIAEPVAARTPAPAGLWSSLAARWNAVWDNPRVGYAGRVWTWSAASACAAAVAVLLFSDGSDPRPVSVAGVDGTATSRFASTSARAPEVSRVRVESIEAGRGHSFSTWEQPRSGARVIWVAKNSGAKSSGARVERASLSR